MVQCIEPQKIYSPGGGGGSHEIAFRSFLWNEWTSPRVASLRVCELRVCELRVCEFTVGIY